MPYSSVNMELLLCPPARGAPDDGLARVEATIAAAQDHVWVATQQLGHVGLARALIAAKHRQIDVRVCLERDYLYEDRPAANPWLPVIGGHEENRQVLQALLRSRIPLRLDRKSRLLHSNFVVTENEVLVTSANLTKTGVEQNSDMIVVIRDQAILGVFDEEFDLLWNDDTSGSQDLVETQIDEVRVKVVFGPRQSPEMEITKQILRAHTSVDMAVFTFSTSSAIDDAVLSALAKGVQVRVIIDTDQVDQRWSPRGPLQAAGAQIRHTGGAGQRMHHKFVVIDDRLLLTGTFNFSATARRSHESVLVLGRHADAANIAQRKFAEYASAEFERIFQFSTP